jgi:hypothetical protein
MELHEKVKKRKNKDIDDSAHDSDDWFILFLTNFHSLWKRTSFTQKRNEYLQKEMNTFKKKYLSFSIKSDRKD